MGVEEDIRLIAEAVLFLGRGYNYSRRHLENALLLEERIKEKLEE